MWEKETERHKYSKILQKYTLHLLLPELTKCLFVGMWWWERSDGLSIDHVSLHHHDKQNTHGYNISIMWHNFGENPIESQVLSIVVTFTHYHTITLSHVSVSRNLSKFLNIFSLSIVSFNNKCTEFRSSRDSGSVLRHNNNITKKRSDIWQQQWRGPEPFEYFLHCDKIN